MIVLPHQAADNWKYLSYLLHSSLNESEHLAEFSNDRNLALSFSGANGDSHPHHAMPDGVPMLLIEDFARGFKSAAAVPCYFPAAK